MATTIRDVRDQKLSASEGRPNGGYGISRARREDVAELLIVAAGWLKGIGRRGQIHRPVLPLPNGVHLKAWLISSRKKSNIMTAPTLRLGVGGALRSGMSAAIVT